MKDSGLAIFTPIPPEQNGIADYSYHLISALQPLQSCTVYAGQPNGIVPGGVVIRDPAQAFRHLRRGDQVLHQIGNNPGHVFVLNALRKWGGVTTLHDQNLHYLYEAAQSSQSTMSRNMLAGNEKLGAVFARHWFKENLKTPANYALFDMLHEVLTLSSAVIVHSRFAKNRIRLLYGNSVSDRVYVVPHLALVSETISEDPRPRHKIPTNVPLILTSGFATAAKRFDWLVQALDLLAGSGVNFFWVHAGKERPDEYGLSDMINRYPQVKSRTWISGYLTEPQLNDWVATCDILVNLRFPSMGESSGTLARAIAAGRCCVVNETAAYSDLPTDAVMHIPISNAVPELANGLGHLIKDPALRATLGDRAMSFARDKWAPRTVAKAYLEIIAEAATRPLLRVSERTRGIKHFAFALDAASLAADIAIQVRGLRGRVNIRLNAASPEQLAEISLRRPNFLQEILPNRCLIQNVAVEAQETAEGAAARSGVDLVLHGICE